MEPATDACVSDIEPDQFTTLCRVVASCLEVAPDQLTAETLLVEELGVDSIDMLALAIGIEKEFDIAISDQAFLRIRTISDMVPYVANGLLLSRKIVISNRVLPRLDKATD